MGTMTIGDYWKKIVDLMATAAHALGKQFVKQQPGAQTPDIEKIKEEAIAISPFKSVESENIADFVHSEKGKDFLIQMLLTPKLIDQLIEWTSLLDKNNGDVWLLRYIPEAALQLVPMFCKVYCFLRDVVETPDDVRAYIWLGGELGFHLAQKKSVRISARVYENILVSCILGAGEMTHDEWPNSCVHFYSQYVDLRSDPAIKGFSNRPIIKACDVLAEDIEQYLLLKSQTTETEEQSE